MSSRVALVLLVAPLSVAAQALLPGGDEKQPAQIPAALRADVALAESLGQQVYFRDRAAEKTTDRLVEAKAFAHPPPDPQGWVTTEIDDGKLRVSYIAKINGSLKAFAEADYDPQRDATSNAHALQEPRPLSAEEIAEAQAVQTVVKEEWLRCAPTYNEVVLGAHDRDTTALRVFLIPARASRDDYPMGGFHLFTTSADGKSVISHFSQTKTCLNGPHPDKTVALMSSQITSPAPTAFHVFMNLNYGLPVYTVTVQNNILWNIKDGKITVASLDGPAKN